MSKNTNKAEKKTKVKKVARPKALHSITFYISSKQIEFFTEALKEVSKRLYDGSKKRTVSKYIRDLIASDFKKRDLLDNDNNPKLEVLDKMKQGEV